MVKLKQHEKAAALYCRLSRDDEFNSESLSIQNQFVVRKGKFPLDLSECLLSQTQNTHSDLTRVVFFHRLI